MLFQWHSAHCWTRDFPGFAASPRVAGSEQHGPNELDAAISYLGARLAALAGRSCRASRCMRWGGRR